MNIEKNNNAFPIKKIKISMIIAALIFAVGGLILYNQAFCCVYGAELLASMGHYEAASGFLDGIDVDNELDYYNEGKYRIASLMFERGDYQSARDRFTELADYSDSKDRACECIQKIAAKLIRDGEYSTANTMLQDILYYKGSDELFKESQYLYALDEIAEGDWFNGVLILWSIRDYKDSERKVEEVVYENTGNSDVEAVIGSGKPIPSEILADYIKLTEKRETLRDGAIATGFYHTVGLKKNGSVIACGSNSYGQCDVGKWKGVTQIAAGAYHTVALLSDGTVVACGDNSVGQCNVGKWKDVVQIKATDYNTAALLSDGSVVTCGYNKLVKAKGWNNIDKLCSGSYAICGINKSGELLTTHPSCALEGNYVDADMSTSYAIGLTYSGDVVYTSDTPCEWNKAASVYAGGEMVAIIDQNFLPSVYDRRKGIYYDLPEGKAASISLGATHFSVLFDDGSVYCSGANEEGQCETADWNLN